MRKGVTLIALVVTLIILLILAAITISFTIGPNSLIKKTQDSKAASRYGTIIDLENARNANNIFLREMEKDGFETESQFISRLRDKNLFIDSQDKYDSETRTLSIAHQGEENYLYSIVLSSADSGIIDGIVKLPTIGDYPERANMTLRIKTTAANQTVTIPISDATGLQINWDTKANPDNFVDVSGANPTHQYAVVKDDYEVQIKGTATDGTIFGNSHWSYTNPNIVEIIYWGENGFTEFQSFGKGMEGSIPLPTRYSFRKVVKFSGVFTDSPSLTGTIPELLFSNAPNVTYYGGIFSDCTGLTGSIPEKLFANSPIVDFFGDVFLNCKNLTGNIPKDLFKNNTNVTRIDSTFYLCSGLTGSIPESLFSNFSKVTALTDVFYSCKGLQGNIPENLFSNLVNAKTFISVFSNCSGLEGNIPANILKQNTKLEDTFALFAQCKGLTGTIPENLFSNCPLMTSVGATFSGCIGLTGAIPENLFINNTEIIDFTQTFSYCTSLTSLPANLFANNTKATKFPWTFDNCTSLTGTAPDLWNRGNVTQFGACFKECTGLSNYASIPANWK